MQEENGAFSSWGTESSESVSQVLTALTELGLSLDDARFVKNGRRWRTCSCASRRTTAASPIRRRTEATCLATTRRSTPSPLSSAPATENPPSTICQMLRPESRPPILTLPHGEVRIFAFYSTHQTLSLYTDTDLCYNYQIKLDDQEAEL